MRYIDSIYDAYSPSNAAEAAVESPITATGSRSSPNSSLRRTRGISQYFSLGSPTQDSIFYKQPISPLKSIDLDDSTATAVSRPEIQESNRPEPRGVISTLSHHSSSLKKALKVLFCGIERTTWRILIVCLVAAIAAIATTIILVLGVGASAPRVELLKGTTIRPLNQGSLITLTENRLIFDGVLQLKPKIYNPNSRPIIIDTLKVHGYYIIKGTSKAEWRKNYIASGATELLTIPGRGSIVAALAMDVRYSSPRPNSLIMQDILSRHSGARTKGRVPANRIELMYQFEVSYHVGKRLKNAVFSGKQMMNSPFTTADLNAIGQNMRK